MMRVLIIGVNPFEDNPGYQLLSLLKTEKDYEIIAVDDSKVALEILKRIGTKIEHVPHPSEGMENYIQCILQLWEKYDADLLIPSTDAHISALSQSIGKYPVLKNLHPSLNWLNSLEIYNKLDMQKWISRFLPTVESSIFGDDNDLENWERNHAYPTMVKGILKGAVKCVDRIDAMAARRLLLTKNPANRVNGGGAYLERYVSGEEHSLFLVIDGNGNVNTMFSFRKLAKNMMGTTLCGQICSNTNFREALPDLVAQVKGPIVLELEWRLESNGNKWIFELNPRFPSWIGALGDFGKSLVRAHIQSITKPGLAFDVSSPYLKEGALFYRLPESGFIPLPSVFSHNHTTSSLVFAAYKPERKSSITQLWPGCSPHQFLVK